MKNELLKYLAMSEKSGYLAEYLKEDGTIQKGIIRFADQMQRYLSSNKVLIELCDENYNPILNASGKIEVVLKYIGKIKTTGFID